MLILYFYFLHKRGDVTSCIVKLVTSCLVKACPSMPWGCNKTWRPSLVSLYFVSATTGSLAFKTEGRRVKVCKFAMG